MGKLLLEHIRSAARGQSPDEDLPTKNTFIHFKVARSESTLQNVPRSRTAPEQTPPQSEAEPEPTMAGEPEEAPLTPPQSEAEAEPTMGPGEPEQVDDQTHQQGDQVEASATWVVDGRKFQGRDCRVATVLHSRVGANVMDIVVTIFANTTSEKRGGNCFKASNGVGTVQLKCSNPIDEELSVHITVGSGRLAQFQRHNFMDNPQLKFPASWDFKSLIDDSVDRRGVALTLQLSSAEDGGNMHVDEHVGNAMIDPAISAFSISGASSEFQATEPHVTRAPIRGLPLSSPPRLPSPLQTPEPSPRLQSDWSSPVPLPTPSSTTVAPSFPPFFTYGDSILFNFTLRRADDCDVGLVIERLEAFQELLVRRIMPGGAVESWNRQCFAGPCASKALVPDDRIVCINGRTDCTGMFEECRGQQLLKIYVVRGDLPHAEIPFGWCGANVMTMVQLIPVPMPMVQLMPVSCARHDMMAMTAACTPQASTPTGFTLQDDRTEVGSDDGWT